MNRAPPAVGKTPIPLHIMYSHEQKYLYLLPPYTGVTFVLFGVGIFNAKVTMWSKLDMPSEIELELTEGGKVSKQFRGNLMLLGTYENDEFEKWSQHWA